MSGYWRSATQPPTQYLSVHNHCWNAVKVDGCWRLLDLTAAAVAGGDAPFYTAPGHFRFKHLPLNAPWALCGGSSEGFMTKEAFFAQPWLAPLFLSAGGRLLSGGVKAETVLKSTEGERLPVAVLELAVPPGCRCYSNTVSHMCRVAVGCSDPFAQPLLASHFLCLLICSL